MTELYSYTGTGNAIAMNALQPQGYTVTLSADGPLNEITIRTVLAGRNFKAALFSHNGLSTGGTERPLNLLSESAVYTSVLNGNITVSFPSAPAGTAGQRFCVIFLSETSGSWLDGGNVSEFRMRGNTLSLAGDFANTHFPSSWSGATAGTTTGRPYLIVSSTQVSIVSISQFISGLPFTFTVSDAGYAANSIALSDGSVTKNIAVAPTGNPGQFTGVAPSPIDGQTMLKLGTITAVATNGVAPTVAANTSYGYRAAQPDNPALVDFVAVEFTSIDPGSFGAGFSPPLKVGTQFIYDSARWDVSVSALMTGNYTGQSIFIDRDPEDYICRFWPVTTQNGVIIEPPISDPKFLQSKTLQSKFLEPKFLTVKFL